MTESELPEDAVTVAMPANRDVIVVDGSERHECSECGTDVWISPVTQLEIERGAYPETIICLPCTGEEAENGG